MKRRTMKATVIKSGLALLMCLSMFIGSTFAWFTDQVSGATNIIQSGSLDIEMQWAKEYDGEDTVWKNAAGDNAEPVFDYENWEPGYSEVRYIKVSNEGNLAFKWLMSIIPTGIVGKLAEAIEVRYDIVSGNPHFVEPTADNKAGSLRNAGMLTDVINGEDTVVQGVLLPEGKEAEGFYSGEIVVCVTLHMQEISGNEFQGEKVGDAFTVLLKATQYSYEYDSFDNKYDKEANYPYVVTDLELSAGLNGKVDENNRLTEEIVLTHAPTGITAVLPVGTIVEGDASQLTLKITEDGVDANVTLDTRVGYDVVVEGVAHNNDKPIVISIPKALPANQIGTQLFHAGKAMAQVYSMEALSQKDGNNDTYGDKYIYDANSGNVFFSLIHFSNVSMASNETVKVFGNVVTGIIINLPRPEDQPVDGVITVPADGNTYILTYDSGDMSKSNPLSQTITHGWYNLNPGTFSETPIKVQMGANVVLKGVNIRTTSGVDAIQIVPNPDPAKKYTTTTRIDIADGTQNWVTGRSGIGFGGNWDMTDVWIEGFGNLYATAIGANCAAIGVSDQSDGDHHKMHFNVSHLRAIPMNNSAGIGSGGNSWRTLSLIEFNGSGLYQIYRGGNAASVGSGLNSDRVGEIIVNDTARVYCYSQPWTAYSRTFGAGIYAGICDGIYVAEKAYATEVTSWVPSGRDEAAKVVVQNYSKLDNILVTMNSDNEITNIVGVKGDNKEIVLNNWDGRVKISGKTVTCYAVYDNETKEAYCLKNAVNVEGVKFEVEATEELPEAEFLYRVGNQSDVTTAQIATMLTGKANDGTNVKIDKHVGEVSYSNKRFTGTGIVKVTIGGKDYFLEVVNAKNITKIESKDTLTENVVLLNDMSYPTGHQRVDMTGNTVYGNGFEIDFSNFYHEADSVNAAIILMNSATFDNVRLVGKVFTDGAYVYHEDAEKAGKLANYQSLIVAYGESKLLNSFVSGTRAPVRINGGTLLIENSTISGGNVANIDVKGGTLNLKNVTTINQSSDVVGFGIFIDNDGGATTEDGYKATINIDGLTSYNWLTIDDKAKMNDTTSRKYMPTILENILSDEKFASADAVNFAIIWLNNTDGIIVNGVDEPVTASISGKEGNLWCQTGTLVEAPEYVSNTYSLIEPEFKWNVSLNPEGEYDISVEQGKEANFADVASALSVTKYGLGLTITYEGVTTYTTAGKYTIKYTVTDDLIYDKDGNKLSAETYIKELVVNVTVAVPSTPAPEFTINHWDGSSVGTYDKNNGLVVKQDPDNPKYYYVSAPKGTTMITIDGQDINAIGVRGMSSLSTGASTSSSTLYYPIFYGINITDGDKSYNTSTTSFPNDVLTMEYLRNGNPDLITNAKRTGKYEGWMTNKDVEYGVTWSYSNVTSKTYYKASDTGSETSLDKLGVSMKSSSTYSSITGENTHYYECIFKGADGNYYVYYIDYYRPYYAKKTSCVTGDTLVTLADGSQKRIDQVTYDDILLAWDFETGEYATAPASFIHNHGMDNYRVLTLSFSDGTKVKVINEHGFFDKNVNDFVYITEENVADYVGDYFVKVDGSSYKTVKLINYKVTEEYVGNYSLQTAVYNNAIVEGMFSMTGPDFEGWFDYFDITDDMKYDEEHKKAEIEKYGLTSYEDWADYVTYEQFVAFNGQYVNILVGRGTVTYENIFEMFETVFGD